MEPIMQAKFIVDLKRITWRGGRPRFEPSPTLRLLGFKGQDLKHPDGTWFSEGECLDWTRTTLDPAIAERRAQRAATLTAGTAPPTSAKPKWRPPMRQQPGYAGRPLQAVQALFIALWQRPEFQAETLTSGRRIRKPLKPKTVSEYRKMERMMSAADPALWASDLGAISVQRWEKFLIMMEERHGLATARACRATLSMAFARMKPQALKGVNPIHGIKMPMPEPRLRVGEIGEMEHLIATADAHDRPEIGDSIMLGLFSGQRQADRLALEGGKMADGDMLFRQAKTGAIVRIPAAPQLIRRLKAAQERRKQHKLQHTTVIIDERINRPWAQGGDHYRHVFADIVAEAAKTVPSLAGFRDQDLRDTSVTWLANAGSTVMEIAAITGHSLQSIHGVLKHYCAAHPDQARAGIGKLLDWLEKKEANL